MSTTVTRACIEHTPQWQRFQPVKNKPLGAGESSSTSCSSSTTYQRQYAHVYYQRLAEVSQLIWKRLESSSRGDDRDGGPVRVDRILDVVEGKLSLVAGTLIRDFLEESDPSASNNNNSNNLFLEDESGRVALSFSESQGTQQNTIVTGIVAVVEGVVKEGVLLVSDLHVPHPRTTVEASVTVEAMMDAVDTPDAIDPPKCLLLVSGLNCGDPAVSALPRDMLLSYLEGCFGVASASTVAQVLIAGGLVSPHAMDRAAALKDLDACILQIAACGVFVDALPGRDDPTTANWPQRPLHRSLLPQSHQFAGKLVHATPNPYQAKLAGRTVVGTDGTNVQDLVKHLNRIATASSGGNRNDNEDPAPGDATTNLLPVTELDALRLLLEWSHLCPTGPDSVPTVPHSETDPMVLKGLPDLLFCGNSTKFATGTFGNCRLICVPTFSQTGQAVLVHLNDKALKVELLCFRAEEQEEKEPEADTMKST